jgi:hypothetical protein
MARIDWWATRKKNPAAAELSSALSRLVRKAYSPMGNSMAQTWAIMTKSGVPGGWGMPSVFAAAMNSPASQKVTVGASVSR